MTRGTPPPPPGEDEIRQVVEHTIGIAPTSTKTLRSGAWSAAIGVTTDSGEFVLRFSRTQDDFRCDLHASRFAGPDLPIPRVYGIGQLEERWWCLSERMPGVHLDDLPPDELEATLPSLARMLIAIRDTDSSATHGFGGWDADGNGRFPSFADQLLDVGVDRPNERGGDWQAFLSEHPYELGIFRDGYAEMERLCAFLPDSRQLIHEDTINYNMTVQNRAISGVFDWGCAMWGDAIYDLAWFKFWQPWYPQWPTGLVDRLIETVGTKGDHAAERMRCCMLHIGIGHIRYNAFLRDANGMNDVALVTEQLLRSQLP